MNDLKEVVEDDFVEDGVKYDVKDDLSDDVEDDICIHAAPSYSDIVHMWTSCVCGGLTPPRGASGRCAAHLRAAHSTAHSRPDRVSQ